MAENEASYVRLTFCANPISRKILILEIYERKLSTNQIASIFQITISFEPFNRFLYFLHEDRIPYDVLGDVVTFLEKCLFAPKKGKKEQKWAGQLEKINFFCILLKIGSLVFFNILYKVRGH